MNEGRAETGWTAGKTGPGLLEGATVAVGARVGLGAGTAVRVGVGVAVATGAAVAPREGDGTGAGDGVRTESVAVAGNGVAIADAVGAAVGVRVRTPVGVGGVRVGLVVGVAEGRGVPATGGVAATRGAAVAVRDATDAGAAVLVSTRGVAVGDGLAVTMTRGVGGLGASDGASRVRAVASDVTVAPSPSWAGPRATQADAKTATLSSAEAAKHRRSRAARESPILPFSRDCKSDTVCPQFAFQAFVTPAGTTR